MPIKMCNVCRKKRVVSQNDWKLLDKDGDYACSTDCLLAWIKKPRDFVLKRDVPKENFTVSPKFGCEYKSPRLMCSFRSAFEVSVAEFLYSKGFVTLYEYVTFHWDGKEYTPDFFFPEYGCFVESKGLWQPSNRSKYRSFRATFPQIPFIVAHWMLAREIPKAKVMGG